MNAACRRGVLARLGLIKENYRGRALPTAAGALIGLSALVAGFASAAWRAPLVVALVGSPSVELKRALVASAGVPAGLIALGAALVGLVDDIAGRPEDKGLRGHLRALREYRVTTGLAKAVYAGLAGFAAAWTLFTFGRGALPYDPSRTVPMLLVDACTMALCMNAFNLLDLRPGRALKVWLPLALALWTAGLVAAPPSLRLAYLQPQLVAGLIVALLILPFDLKERVMLGDAGSMAMGALVGWSIIATMSVWVRVTALVLLAALHLATERVSLSDLIDRTAALRWLDRLGRPD